MAITGKSKQRQRGFTLLESLTTVAVSAVVASTALPSYSRWIAQQGLSGAAQQVLADLHWVRTEAVARQQSLRLSMMKGPLGSCYTVHTGGAGACSCMAGVAAADFGSEAAAPSVCSAGSVAVKTVRWAAASRVALTATTSTMLFDPVYGTSTPTGTLTVSNTQGQQLRHVVNIMGRVRTCSPGGPLSGHPAC
jgi:type IV fimbrial biogenesis protein FimT